jgi:hypothetical protein
LPEKGGSGIQVARKSALGIQVIRNRRLGIELNDLKLFQIIIFLLP